MAITLQRAKTVCTAAELAIVNASTRKRVEGLTAVRLRQKIALARRLRDKYRDIADRQKRELRGKRAPRGTNPAIGNANTRLKQQIFQETLERFEAALAAASGTGAGPARKKKRSTGGAARKTAPAKAPAPAKKKTRRTKKAAVKPTGEVAAPTPAAQQAVEFSFRQRAAMTKGKHKQRLIEGTGSLRRFHSVAANTRRNQAKRDSRGRR